MPYKDIAKELFIIFGLAVITAFTVNSFSPKGIALFGNWDISKGVITARAKDDFVFHELEIEDINMAKKIYDMGNTVFVDARFYDLYKDGHIRGAVSLPVYKFDEFIEPFISKYKTTTFIVTYCSGRECDDGHKLAQYLFEKGYQNVSVFIDGYPGWKDKGYPID